MPFKGAQDRVSKVGVSFCTQFSCMSGRLKTRVGADSIDKQSHRNTCKNCYERALFYSILTRSLIGFCVGNLIRWICHHERQRESREIPARRHNESSSPRLNAVRFPTGTLQRDDFVVRACCCGFGRRRDYPDVKLLPAPSPNDFIIVAARATKQKENDRNTMMKMCTHIGPYFRF